MPAVVLFDGVCNLCNRSVDFIIERDAPGYFRFAPLQSDVARRLLAGGGVSGEIFDSIVLIEDGVCHTRSTAALRIARRLRAPWWMLHALIVLPRRWRDAAYDWIAHSRYRWFGRRETCRLPSPELDNRFLTDSDASETIP